MKSVLSESHNSVSKPNARRRVGPRGFLSGAEQAARSRSRRKSQIQSTLSAGVIALEISNRNARVAELQQRWAQLREKLETIMLERGATMAEAPGGSTGLYAKDFKDKYDTPVYKIDPGIVALFGELRAIEKQASEKLGQWTEKQVPLGSAAVRTSITVRFIKPGPPMTSGATFRRTARTRSSS